MNDRQDEYARQIICEGQRRGITPKGIVIALATVLVETNMTMYANPKVPESMSLPHDAVGSDGHSVGLFQQQVVYGNGGWWWGDVKTCMDPALSAGLFYDRLVKFDYNNQSAGYIAQAIQDSAYPDRYEKRMGEAQAIYTRLVGETLSKSENGWEPSHAGPDILEWVTVPGTNVRLQLMKGWPSIIMRAYAADYNQFVEPLRDRDSAGWTPTNAVATSNHLNGTAMDLNWDSHPFRVSYAGYDSRMIGVMRAILDFYEQTMFWSQDWDEPKDCMHHQMGYNTWYNPHTQNFINRKIRADGFSTFRRGPQALGDDELDATQAQMLSDIHTALFEPRPSTSKYVDDRGTLWRLVDLLRIDDGRGHEVAVERQALLGNPEAIALVKREADQGDQDAAVVYRQCPGVST